MKVFFSVGEPSGDEHAAALIQQMRQRQPDLVCCGYGGEEMREAGCDLHFRLTDLAVMGILRVIPLLYKFWSLVRKAKKIFVENPPDAVVLVDFPGFNWHIAKAAKRAGIPVFYYMPPQLWAWGSWRVKKMQKYVDHVISGLEFESKWYRDHGVDVEYVGHPFFDEVARHQLDEEFISEWKPRGRIIGILPGSRTQEVHANFPQEIRCIERIHELDPEATFLVACYRDHHYEWCQNFLQEREGKTLPITLCKRKTSEIIELADFCVMVSGSVSLELLARKTPAVIMYACGEFFYKLADWLTNVDSATLPNLMSGRTIYPEWPLPGKDPENMKHILRVVEEWAQDPDALERARAGVIDYVDEVNIPGAAGRCADYILSETSETVSTHRSAA